jgi:formylglycine-generating enzyme required for sulfatase activity
VVIDQLELWLADAGSLRLILDELLELDRRPAGARLAVVLSVREDFVAQLLTTTAALSTGAPMVRLAPLDRDGAERALGVPLQRRGVKMSAELMQLVLDELVHAGQEHGSQSGWGHTSAVYPPHLQLVGAALFSALAPGETELTLAHYERLGRLEAVVGELLERILRELSAEDRRIARALFLAFVGSAQTRVARSEEELAHRFGMAMQDPALARVLGLLEAHRLLLRRLQADATVIWELMHDSLVPRIEAWLTVQDLDRRRAAELLRFHLRESTPQAPSLLSARQLALVAQFPGLVEELEQEWLRRPAADWTPQRLLARSRMTAQYRRALSATVAGTALVLAALLAWNLWTERARRAQEALLRDRDLGRFDLVLAPFDWRADPAGVQQLPVDSALLPALHWTLHDPDPGDPSLPGPAVSSDRLRHGQVLRVAGHRIEKGIEARGGDGFLMISGRGGVRERCPASVVPIRRLPGYATHGAPPRVLRVAVPTCQATRFDTIDIPAGPFVSGGAGEPPPSFQAHELPAENPAKWLATYAIDRTEITNAAYAAFASMASLTGTLVVEPPASLPQAADPTRPRTDLNAFDAAAFCRYLGKQLPDNDQWQKAMRGGLLLPDGTRNPQPRRNLPWGTASTGRFPAHLADTVPRRPGSHETAPGASDVEAYPGDRSPYGVIGLAGNVQEWTRTSMPRPAKNPGAPVLLPMRITRGGNWSTTSSSELVDYMVSENERSPRQLNYYLGARCVLDVNAGSAAALAPVPSPAPAGRPPHAGSRR